jgi:hypothetical protein
MKILQGARKADLAARNEDGSSATDADSTCQFFKVLRRIATSNSSISFYIP